MCPRNAEGKKAGRSPDQDWQTQMPVVRVNHGTSTWSNHSPVTGIRGSSNVEHSAQLQLCYRPFQPSIRQKFRVIQRKQVQVQEIAQKCTENSQARCLWSHGKRLKMKKNRFTKKRWWYCDGMNSVPGKHCRAADVAIATVQRVTVAWSSAEWTKTWRGVRNNQYDDTINKTGQSTPPVRGWGCAAKRLISCHIRAFNTRPYKDMSRKY